MSAIVGIGENSGSLSRKPLSGPAAAKRIPLALPAWSATAGAGPAASDKAASIAHPKPLRWRRVAVAAVAAFGIAVGVITGVEAVAQQPLASLVGSRPQQAASTSVGVVVAAEAVSAYLETPSWHLRRVAWPLGPRAWTFLVRADVATGAAVVQWSHADAGQ